MQADVYSVIVLCYGLSVLTHGTRISLSMAVGDFSVSASLSHPRIKLLSQTVNNCYIYIYNPRNCFYNICSGAATAFISILYKQKRCFNF